MTSDRPFTEIPEPDYNDSDDEVTDPAVSGCVDNEVSESQPETNTERAADDAADDDAGQVDVEVEVDRTNDNDVDETFDFDDVRAKLEVFSVEQQQLRGSVPPADQGCRHVERGADGMHVATRSQLLVFHAGCVAALRFALTFCSS